MLQIDGGSYASPVLVIQNIYFVISREMQNLCQVRNTKNDRLFSSFNFLLDFIVHYLCSVCTRKDPFALLLQWFI